MRAKWKKYGKIADFQCVFQKYINIVLYGCLKNGRSKKSMKVLKTKCQNVLIIHNFIDHSYVTGCSLGWVISLYFMSIKKTKTVLVNSS